MNLRANVYLETIVCLALSVDSGASPLSGRTVCLTVLVCLKMPFLGNTTHLLMAAYLVMDVHSDHIVRLGMDVDLVITAHLSIVALSMIVAILGVVVPSVKRIALVHGANLMKNVNLEIKFLLAAALQLVQTAL